MISVSFKINESHIDDIKLKKFKDIPAIVVIDGNKSLIPIGILDSIIPIPLSNKNKRETYDYYEARVKVFDEQIPLIQSLKKEINYFYSDPYMPAHLDISKFVLMLAE